MRKQLCDILLVLFLCFVLSHSSLFGRHENDNEHSNDKLECEEGCSCSKKPFSEKRSICVEIMPVGILSDTIIINKQKIVIYIPVYIY